MSQVAFTLLGIPFFWYGVMLASAFIAGLANATLLGRRTGRTFALFSDLLFWVVVSGIVGARLAYVASNWDEFSQDILKLVNLRSGGLVFYGGLVGAVLAFLVFARRTSERVWSLGDVAITSVPLGHALGRIGCFLQGCCHGTPTTSPLGVVYPVHSPAWYDQMRAGLFTGPQCLPVNGVVHPVGSQVWSDQVHSGVIAAPQCLPVHPVQLYESAANLAVWALLIFFYRRPHRDGRVVALYVMLYAFTRFSLEFFRGDDRLRSAGLTFAQWTSVALFAVALGIWYWTGRAAATEPARTDPGSK